MSIKIILNEFEDQVFIFKNKLCNLFWGGTFGAGAQYKVKNFDFFYIVWGPVQKVPLQNEWTKFILEIKIWSSNSYQKYYNTQRNKKVIKCWSWITDEKLPKLLKKQTPFGRNLILLTMLWHIVHKQLNFFEQNF